MFQNPLQLEPAVIVPRPDDDGVSRLGLGLETVTRPIFASLGLEGFRSRDFEYCKDTVY